MARRGPLGTTLNTAIARAVGGRGAGGGTSLLLDTYTGAAAAYSLRKLRSGYTGNAIRVRRSSDSAEQEIGFASGVLDTASLTTFCGAGDGFVVTWYDQSENSRNVTQATTTLQPQIVSAGSVITEGSNPAVQFDGTDDCLTISSISLDLATFSSFSVFRFSSTPTSFIFSYSLASDSADRHTLFNNAPTSQFIFRHGGSNPGAAVSGNLNHNIASCVYDASAENVAINGSAFTTNAKVVSATADRILIGSRGGLTFPGKLQEHFSFAADMTDEKAAIESNMAAFYGITLP